MSGVIRTCIPGPVVENEDGSLSREILRITSRDSFRPIRDDLEDEPVRAVRCDALNSFIHKAQEEEISPEQILAELVQFCTGTEIFYVGSEERTKVLVDGEIRL